jgi:cellulose synthase/poly-beta-1,6-N-acetylglucosamine synthase-like glycosyltransferase
MWQLLFLGSVAVILYTYFGYPAILFLLGRFGGRKPGSTADSVELPSVCLIISAFNEEQVIRDKIENSLSQRYPSDGLTVLVASDGSTDGTVRIAREFSDDRVEVFDFPTRRGKSAVLNDIIGQRREEVVVFTDANALFKEDAVDQLARRFADPSIGCVVGRLRYRSKGSSSVGKAEGIYWSYESVVSRLESALSMVLVANGSIFAIRRELFKELYPEVANDFQIPIDIAAGGHGVVYEPGAEATEFTTEYWREEFHRKMRIVLRGLTGFSKLRPRIRGFRLWQFVSHKLVRWIVGLFLVTAFIANAVLAASSSFYVTTFLVQVAFYLFALVGSRLWHTEQPWRLVYIPFYFTMVNAAAMAGAARFVVGHRQAVWEKAESTRSVTAQPYDGERAESGERGAGADPDDGAP